MFRANGPNGSVPLLIVSVQSVSPSFLQFLRGSCCPNLLVVIWMFGQLYLDHHYLDICIFGYLDYLDVDAYLDIEYLDGFQNILGT